MGTPKLLGNLTVLRTSELVYECFNLTSKSSVARYDELEKMHSALLLTRHFDCVLSDDQQAVILAFLLVDSKRTRQ